MYGGTIFPSQGMLLCYRFQARNEVCGSWRLYLASWPSNGCHVTPFLGGSMSARNGQLRDRRHARPAVGVSRLRLALSSVVVVFFAAGIAAGDTRTGEIIAASAQRFLVFYSGVFALVGLTMAVAAGLTATDRIVMSPGNRIVSQAMHRAIAFVAVAFLITHIAMEVLVGKSAVIDSVVPFLAKGRTFYIGVGTIASDLFILIIATGIARKYFAEKSSAMLWRVLHGTAYLAWPLSIVHGLAAGRHAKPYVSWSYGVCMILVGLALVLRSVATVRPRQAAVQAWPDQAGFPMPAVAVAAAHAYVLQNRQASGHAALSAGMPIGLQAAARAALPQAALPAGPSAMQPAADLTGTQLAMQQTPVQQAAQPAIVQPAIPPTAPGTPWPGTPVPQWERARESSWARAPHEPPQWEHRRQWDPPQWESAEWEAAEWEARWQQPAQWAHTPPYGMAIPPQVAGAQGYGQAPRPLPGDQPPVGWAQTPAHGMQVPQEPVTGPPHYQSLRPVPPDDPPTGWASR
jgi:DMSO/TMAO reductase YedYZ heme-binding membrane subunit